ncbi:16S rRNA (cytidine(1402)-2'-O)-methyltransferase [Bacillus sp. HMF5848]|uniref:16S rRNA (cytidine(1402)-2'-O)-methyltransferase n=1 Tax=Bacillus sp. HMF5848 TaxID=2495421 RepID=UPI000F798E3F|nr:16S rRNA (cytidine(1402)-2'-O)-methyltransferase [Bacillus sp. HMF5848]RSK25470.1 16S rRNA (cytidine(1402)-2'-O)-methyltransferase [Bacillus sp. HMF5848]
MWQQKSFEQSMQGGVLYLVPTPIGNLDDMTFRAIHVLKQVDYIAAEDTRHTKKLCNHFEINTSIVSYHEHNKQNAGSRIMEDLISGKQIALVSDAGMPTISDPGFELVAEATANQLKVVALPGANAALTALTASGLMTQPFYFYGFINRQKRQRLEELNKLKNIQATIMLYESPHRIGDTLQAILEVFGNRRISIARELTKRYEEYIRGSVEECLAWANKEEVKGELCLIIEGFTGDITNEASEWWQTLSIAQHVEHYIQIKELPSKDAIKQVAKDRDMQKREVYQAYHVE